MWKEQRADELREAPAVSRGPGSVKDECVKVPVKPLTAAKGPSSVQDQRVKDLGEPATATEAAGRVHDQRVKILVKPPTAANGRSAYQTCG